MNALARVLAEPHSLEARKQLGAAWAAARDPRADLLRTQLELFEMERGGRYGGPAWEALRKTERELVAANGKRWAGKVAELVDRYVFHRGLIAEVKTTVDRLIEVGDELFALAPIQHLNLRGPLTRWSELCAAKWLAQVVSLAVTDARELGDREAVALARSRYGSRLRWLDFTRCNVGRPGVEALAASPHLDRVAYVRLEGNPCDPTPQVFSDGPVASVTPTRVGSELVKTFGPRPWLVGPSPERALSWPPIRDHLAID